MIQFSYIGYVTKEITVDSQKNINVQLAEDAQKLDEVVVVGYGTPRKATWPGLLSVPIWELCRNHRISAWVRHYRGRFPD